MKQAIGLNSVINARELGGYINSEGKRIKKGFLIRTGKLNTISEEDIHTLQQEYNLKKIFDFRGSIERELEPDPVISNVDNHWIPILDESNNDENESVMREMNQDMFKTFMYFIENGMMEDIYSDMLKNEYSQKQYSSFLKEIIQTEDGAILWHCSAGKDRTGLAALFILSILNFEEELILYDYELTNHFVRSEIENRIDEFLKKGCPKKYIPQVQCIDGVNVEYFKKGIDYINNNYGSVMEYIYNQLHISEEECEIVRKRYLE